MITLHDRGVYLVDGRHIVPDDGSAIDTIRKTYGLPVTKDGAKGGTMARRILDAHDTSKEEGKRRLRFDALVSHDITYVGIIQTARASGLTKFPMPYVLTNCHNSLCAVGGTINEDDHLFGLSAAKKYGGVYVPPHLAVIHQYAREMMTGGGKMILGSDSHTRYGAFGTMAIGEGGPELVKQLLGRTYDIAEPEVVGVYLRGVPRPGIGPQDIALALIGAVFDKEFVKNRILEFVGPGIGSLSVDFRCGIDVMTTETTCLSSIWETDEEVRRYYGIHGRAADFRQLSPAPLAYYDRFIEIDLSEAVPMIAMPYHPSCVYTIADVVDHPAEVMAETEERAKTAFGDRVRVDLMSKIRDGKVCVDQAVIAGCAGGGFENLCDAADILRGRSCGSGAFSLSVYPASQPVLMELIRCGAAEKLISSGAVLKTAFCGPCFGAGDTPANNALSIRHSTRNFPNREGSKVGNGQIASVALMDARSIAATAANGGVLTPATDLAVTYTRPYYRFDGSIYEKRVYSGIGDPKPEEELVYGPNIKDWPKMPPLPENLVLKVVSEIHDPVTTTDELIPSGETSSLRSNPEALSQFALSRKDPEYVPLAKEVREAERAREKGSASEDGNAEDCAECRNGGAAEEVYALLPGLAEAFAAMEKIRADASLSNTGIGSTIFAEKPGDGSAREQAASCQKVLGGWANVARQYATKRYRSNLINWGMLPFTADEGSLPFGKGDFLFLPGIRDTVLSGREETEAYVLRNGAAEKLTLYLGSLTEAERRIIAEGCLINYYRSGSAAL